nr:M14 family metallopeptidase [Pseudolysobacter antarcticus]
MRNLIFATTLVLAASSVYAAGNDPLSTVAERSGFLKTGRYDEVIELCNAFQNAYPKQVRCIEFGRTPEGGPMKALVVTRTGALTAEEARSRDLPVLLIQGGIHAGEIDGKDAGFLTMREILDNKSAKGALDNVLDKQVIIFVPVFNVDGHERFGRWNRPNQRGPEEMGWRTTAQNLNLNRDYVKADAPEMQAMLRLVNAWDPLAYIDLHVTDGAKFEHDVSIQVEPAHAGDAELQKAGIVLRDAVIADVAKKGSLPLPYYPSFIANDDPSSGFEDSVPPPRFSDGYFLLRNRFGMLVETHSWKNYKTRVGITHNTLVAVIGQIAAHGADWLKAARAADTRAEKLAGQTVPLDYKASAKTRIVDFRGYAYTRTMSDVSGALMTHYDEKKPQIWKLPLHDDIQPIVSIAAPQSGYLVPVAFASAVALKLQQHGIEFRVVNAPQAKVEVEAFRASKANFSAQSFEGHQTLTVQGAWKTESRDLAAGALFVPIAQAKSRLVMELLEPQAPDSLAAWGEFNNAFEQKEYMEEYVAEDVAREQLAANPALAAEFKKKLADDADFAKNPQARLQFFAKRHSSWDERLNLYPVLRTAVAPER